MRVGVPREIKPDEYRVGLTPTAVREYVSHGHEVLVEKGAGAGAGYPDEAYTRAGAKIAADADAVFAGSELIVFEEAAHFPHIDFPERFNRAAIEFLTR